MRCRRKIKVGNDKRKTAKKHGKFLIKLTIHTEHIQQEMQHHHFIRYVLKYIYVHH